MARSLKKGPFADKSLLKKIDEMNKIVAESGAKDAKKWDFKNYIQQAWDHAMNNTDSCLIVAQKPDRKNK